ncbi:DUF3825 domain-containing protein [Brachyspira pilosicoli]
MNLYDFSYIPSDYSNEYNIDFEYFKKNFDDNDKKYFILKNKIAMYYTSENGIYACFKENKHKKNDKYKKNCNYYFSGFFKEDDFYKKMMSKSIRYFSFFADYDKFLEDLANMAEAESWHNIGDPNKYNILKNYIHHTFLRLFEQNKIKYYSNGDKACINTGLLTRNFYEDIYMYFETNDTEFYRYKFIKCATSSDNCFEGIDLPEHATYVTDPSEVIFNSSYEVRTDWKHILSDEKNRNRFPEKYRNMDDDLLYPILEKSLEMAKKRAARNYRIAVPQFYSGNLQLLLPVVLGKGGEADLALVFKRYQYQDEPESKNKFYYKVYSNLTLSMAYNNARLLSRPASEWLDKVLDK